MLGRILVGILILTGLSFEANAQEGVPLPVDEAFAMSAASARDGGVIVRIDMPVGYYLYRNKLQFGSRGFEIAGVSLPDGETEHDPYLGQIQILGQSVTVKVKVKQENQDALRFLVVKFQGCARDLICYPPSTRVLAVQK